MTASTCSRSGVRDSSQRQQGCEILTPFTASRVSRERRKSLSEGGLVSNLTPAKISAWPLSDRFVGSRNTTAQGAFDIRGFPTLSRLAFETPF
jgi:hypothetical protein